MALSVQVISATSQDLSLVADSSGNFSFSLPEGTDYIIVVSKDNKVGMHMGSISSTTDAGVTHQLPAYSDTTTTPCIGTINDKNGVATKAKNIIVLDETTNKEIVRLENSDMINFPGEKNHKYRIEIRNENGDTTIHKIQVEPTSTVPRTWTMTLEEAAKPLTMAARIFNADNDQPLANAHVEIMTFSESNLELSADSEGRVDFTLPTGTTFLLIGSNAQYSGMLSGVAEKGQDKVSIIHPVPAFGDKDTLDTKLLMALVTDQNGDLIKDPIITVKDKISGDSIPVKISDGLLYFKGKIGKSYTISVDHNDFDSFGEEVTITDKMANVEKISVVLKRDLKPTNLQFALRVFKDSDKTNLAGATVTIISSSDADHELINRQQRYSRIFPGGGHRLHGDCKKRRSGGKFPWHGREGIRERNLSLILSRLSVRQQRKVPLWQSSWMRTEILSLQQILPYQKLPREKKFQHRKMQVLLASWENPARNIRLQ